MNPEELISSEEASVEEAEVLEAGEILVIISVFAEVNNSQSRLL
ncbi:MAG: hypothetical protein RBS23_03930 [Mariniphaga sp.]|jgi:hypothetical protein|nr:hypothetical protein [Mariniphaga sp.]